ncbi:YciI family protein [Porphyrobacter sp. YT40]|uniref:YciI family protein n=1 Tax=Porphyrobacter sp. YT40 TaxID=2547601 RepID=UPI0018F8CAF9|nr:YciI family protein [Porphyrobacter sp. YT40]
MASIFIASLTYTVPIERIDAVLADHLAWLKAGHEAGKFIAWGPREPRDGGLIFVKAPSRAEAEALLASDPFMLHQLADLTITEWIPRMAFPGLEAFND